jgi:hypothetical protein
MMLTNVTGREEEAIATTRRVRALSDDAFYITGVHSVRAWMHLTHGDLAAAGQALREGLADGARKEDMKAIEATIAAREGRLDEARRLVHELHDTPGLGATSLTLVTSAALQLGEADVALRFLDRPILRALAPTLARLDPFLHPILDHAPYAPRRRDATLVWPLEAPMIDGARHRLFREVRIESGLSTGSDVR